jgi:hypothetical protein
LAPSATSISASSQPKELTPRHSNPIKSSTSTPKICYKLIGSLKRASPQDPEVLSPKEEDPNKEDSEADPNKEDLEADPKTDREEASAETEAEEADSEEEAEDDLQVFA